jgi:small redox-active disulfide protein 2
VKITVYGAGCARCERAVDVVKEVVRLMNMPIELEILSCVDCVLDAGIMMTPAIEIDGKRVCEGRTPSPAEVRQWIIEAQK